MSSRIACLMFLAMAAFACGEERGAASPSAGATQLAIEPAHPSRDPPPAVPLIEPRDDAADGGSNEAGASKEALPISDADVVIAGLRAKFRACYQSGLNDDPKMQGRVVLSTKVSPDGSVESVSASSGSGLSHRVVTCLEDTIKSAHFSAPHGGGSTLQVPVAFVPHAP